MIPKYNGKNIVRGYSTHFGVDLLCAAKELKQLGYHVEQRYIEQLKIDVENRAKKTKKRKEQRLLSNEEDHIFLEGLIDEEEYVYTTYEIDLEDDDFHGLFNEDEYIR